MEFFPSRDCTTEICCYLVFKPILVQYQTANTLTPDSHSSLSAEEVRGGTGGSSGRTLGSSP